jgi:two-component system response regulator VanR
MRVLVVEDEAYLVEAVRAGLAREGMAVDVVLDGDAALERLAVNQYDVVVLDRDIPGTHGDDVCRAITREHVGPRVLMLTAAGQLADKVVGFELGADDYLTKPFALRELVIRLRALGRRPASAAPPTIEYAGVRLDPFRREVSRLGREFKLTRKQFAVLEILLVARGGVISAEELLERAWDENADPFTNAIRVTISTLRKQLGDPWIIHTVPGVGYRMVEIVDGLQR